MTGFNLSHWALHHRPLVVYIMLVAVIAGVFSYFRLGRAEDPTFVIKTMIVQAAWPGASVEETLKQVTERLERKLQETPKLDFLRSFTSAGVTTIFVNLQGDTTAREVADIWYHVRKSIGDIRHTLPAGDRWTGLQRRFRRYLRHHLRLHGRRFHPPRTSRSCRGCPLASCSKSPTFRRSRFWARRTSAFSSSSRCRSSPVSASIASALIAALQTQNIVRPAGTIQTGNETAVAARLGRV